MLLIALGVVVPILTIGVIVFCVIRFRQKRAWQKELGKGKALAGTLMEHRNASPSPSLNYNSLIHTQMKLYSSPDISVHGQSGQTSPGYNSSVVTYGSYSTSHRRGSRRGSGRHGYMPCEPPANENYYATVPKTATGAAPGAPGESPKHHKCLSARGSFEKQDPDLEEVWKKETESPYQHKQSEACYANLTPVRKQSTRSLEQQLDDSPYYQTVEEAHECGRKVHTVIV